ncbi:hypothetical protein F4821DRAFT_236565 [Hypoxylon rubiginosum]|uniref:Uncharacterized protein n=1 Tax=Hypoxylon rubiginosum TaxID=110542 RepID=A0ACC0D361_9PEZI|nr:hypothetical protein F4821DRAFT_236565 [Hypoxylon rubiginosum]
MGLVYVSLVGMANLVMAKYLAMPKHDPVLCHASFSTTFGSSHYLGACSHPSIQAAKFAPCPTLIPTNVSQTRVIEIRVCYA